MKKNKTIVTKIISYVGKTYEQLQMAYMALKLRYRKTVKLGKMIAMGCGLYRGTIEVA